MSRTARRFGLVLTAAALASLGFPGQAGAGPGVVVALLSDYSPSPVHLTQGEGLQFANLDPIGGMIFHSLDQVVPGCALPALQYHDQLDAPPCPARRFSSGTVPFGEIKPVTGVETLPPGTYKFACRLHESRLWGTLVVE